MYGYFSKVYKEESYTTKNYQCVITLGKRSKDGKYEVNVTADCDDKSCNDKMEVTLNTVYGKLKNARAFYNKAKKAYIDNFKECTEVRIWD